MQHSAFKRSGARGRRFKVVHLHRITGRFPAYRNLIALWRRAAEPIFRGVGRSFAVAPTVFGGVSLEDSIQELRETGFYAGYQLSPTMLDDIWRYACDTPCKRAEADSERFLIAEVKNGLSPMGKPVAIADVDMLAPCPAIEALVGDALLVETAKRFLRYSPRRCDRRLFWSPASALPDDVRRSNGQTIDFHYDIDRSNSLYFFFYITNTARDSGSHVLLPKSHKRKPLAIMFSSCFQPDWKIKRFYGDIDATTIEGDPGFGFAEDPACFHKALIPMTATRLVLQLRYS